MSDCILGGRGGRSNKYITWSQICLGGVLHMICVKRSSSTRKENIHWNSKVRYYLRFAWLILCGKVPRNIYLGRKDASITAKQLEKKHIQIMHKASVPIQNHSSSMWVRPKYCNRTSQRQSHKWSETNSSGKKHTSHWSWKEKLHRRVWSLDMPSKAKIGADTSSLPSDAWLGRPFQLPPKDAPNSDTSKCSNLLPNFDTLKACC